MTKAFLKNNKLKSGAVIFDVGQLYSVDLSGQFTDQFKKQGGTISVFDGILSAAETFDKPLNDIKTAKPDFIFLPMYEETTVRFLNQLLAQGSFKGSIVGGDGWEVGSIFKSSIVPKYPVAEVAFVTHHSALATNSLQILFESKYKLKYGIKPTSSAAYLAFDTMLVIGRAFEGKRPADQQELRNRIANDLKVTGVTGIIEFKGHQEPVGKQLYLTHFKGAVLQSVEKIHP